MGSFWIRLVFPLVIMPFGYLSFLYAFIHFDYYYYYYYYYYYSKLAALVEGDPKAPFSIATILRCRGGRFSFPWIVPL